MNEAVQISPQSGSAFRLKKNQILQVTDIEGQQVSDLFCFNAKNKSEYFSSARSMDYADKIYLSKNDVLYSNRSRKMLRIIKDDCGRHDLLMPPCSLEMFHIVQGNQKYHPSCHGNLEKNLKKFGIKSDQVSTTFNIFMNVVSDSRGRVTIKAPKSKRGDSISFLAEMDLIVGLTACSHPGSNHGRCKPIQYQIINS